MKFSTNKKLIFYITVILYRVSLDLIYSQCLSTDWYFTQYTNTYAPSMWNFALSFIFIVLYTYFIVEITARNLPSSTFLMLLFLLAYVPNNSIYFCRKLSDIFFVFLNVYWAFLFLFYHLLSKVRIKQLSQKITIGEVGNSRGLLKGLLKIFPFALFAFIFFFAYRYYGGLFKLTINLTKSNDLRMVARVSQNQFTIRRVLPWAATIVFPLCIVHYAKKRKYIPCILLAVGIIICYSITGMKQWLFVFLITIIAIVYVKIKRNSDYIKYFPVGLAVLNIMCLILNHTLGERQIINYTSRRVLFGPCLNNLYHIEYFYGQPKMYLTQSLFGWVRKLGVSIPYTDDISYVIGRMYYSDETAAPAGTFADAFENFGVFGMAFYPLILVIVVLLFDRVARDVRPEFYLCVIFIFAYTVLSGGLTNAILSYGLLFAIIYIALLKKAGIYDMSSSQFEL